MTQSPKLILTAAWSLSVLHVVTVLPKGLEFNAGYYIT
jgi:hypothetical protein